MLAAVSGARAAFARVAVEPFEAVAARLAETRAAALAGAAADATVELRAVGPAVARPAMARALAGSTTT